MPRTIGGVFNRGPPGLSVDVSTTCYRQSGRLPIMAGKRENPSQHAHLSTNGAMISCDVTLASVAQSVHAGFSCDTE